MNTIFMNSESSKTFKPYVLILTLTNKLDLKRGEKIKIKTVYYLKLLTPEAMPLLASTENNVPHLDITEVVLISVHCNIVNNDYQQDSRVVKTFVSNKPFSSLLEISTKNHVFLKNI